MTISGISGNANAGAMSSPVSLNAGEDAYSKSLQKQIADAQKQLQELSQNNEIDPETKMKKRQELQKQISDLNMQLRQHQMEERRKAQQEKQENNAPQKPEENTAGLSQKSMETVISAEGSLKQAKIQGDTADRLESDAEIKRAEIARDGGGEKRRAEDSAAISRKWDDVEKLERNAYSARVSLASSLAEAEEEISGADESGNAKAEEDSEKNNNVSDEEQKESEEQKKADRSKTAEVGSNVDVRV